MGKSGWWHNIISCWGGKGIDKIFKPGTALNLLSNGGLSYTVNHFSPLGDYMSDVFGMQTNFIQDYIMIKNIEIKF